ncbi:MAG: response regulator [FCB group bacterium]|nr:response regulator [FCB group bacterium]
MAENSNISKKKVLVVEDDTGILKTLEEVFLLGGYEVKTAVNGKEGIPVFKEYRPDIVITDILMPEMDGIEMIGELRKIQYDLKVIFITAWFEKKDIALKLNKEFQKFPHYRLMKKPFKIETVWRMTEEYLAE